MAAALSTGMVGRPKRTPEAQRAAGSLHLAGGVSALPRLPTGRCGSRKGPRAGRLRGATTRAEVNSARELRNNAFA